MTTFVIDASATLPWCLKDEETAWTLDLLQRLDRGDRIIVPAHWPTEVANGLLMATRRGRLRKAPHCCSWTNFRFPITVRPPLSPIQVKDVLSLCSRHRLTVYDAAYLELAKRNAVPLATLDEAMRKAALMESIRLLD